MNLRHIGAEKSTSRLVSSALVQTAKMHTFARECDSVGVGIMVMLIMLASMA